MSTPFVHLDKLGTAEAFTVPLDYGRSLYSVRFSAFADARVGDGVSALASITGDGAQVHLCCRSVEQAERLAHAINAALAESSKDPAE